MTATSVYMPSQNQEVKELQADIRAKDVELLAEKAAHCRVETERQALLVEIARVQRSIAVSSQESAATQKELDNMCAAINVAGQVVLYSHMTLTRGCGSTLQLSVCFVISANHESTEVMVQLFHLEQSSDGVRGKNVHTCLSLGQSLTEHHCHRLTLFQA